MEIKQFRYSAENYQMQILGGKKLELYKKQSLQKHVFNIQESPSYYVGMSAGKMSHDLI